jgi:hypothetical protein
VHDPSVAKNSYGTRLAGLLSGGTARQWRAAALAFALLVAAACNENQSTEPAVSVPVPQAAETCSAECVLANSVAPFRAARFHADSIHMPVSIGDVEVSGSSGARIILRLSADPEILRTVGPKVRLLVEAHGTTRSFELAGLQGGVAVYTFTRAERLRLRYSLERQAAASVADGHVRFVQLLIGSATVVSARRRWMPEAKETLSLQSLVTCSITGPITTGCDNTVTTSPYAPAENFGATFQSNPGFGASQPITINFAKAVRAVTIKIFDSDCSGNKMIASDAVGIIETVSFPYDNQPGNDAINASRTITAPEGRNITKVELIPDPCEYVAYSGSWEPLPGCTTGDPNLDDPVNREKFDSSFQASNPDGPQSERREHIRAGYRLPDGQVVSIDLNPSSANNCEIPSVFVPHNTTDGGKLVWIWHSHPYAPRELVTECAGRVLTPPRPLGAGPSQKDWMALDTVNKYLALEGEPPIPGYIYDKQQSYRQDPNSTGLPRNRFTSFDRPACQ